VPRRRQANESQEVAGQVIAVTNGSQPAPSPIEAFAEDLGRLLGSARAKADSWLEQRQAVVKELTSIRDAASGLLDRLGHQAASTTRTVSRLVGGQRTPTAPAAAANEGASAPARRRRKLSAAARAKISAAQKARWAKVRRAQK
jgi:hypothetical protein